MTVHYVFSERELSEGLRLLRTLNLLAATIQIGAPTNANGQAPDAVVLFGQALESMNCTREELNNLGMLLNCAMSATLEASGDALFDGLEHMLDRRAAAYLAQTPNSGPRLLGDGLATGCDWD